MGRTPCCEKEGLKKGPWTPEEDKILVDYIQSHGHGSWRSLPKLASLKRCGKSCRLRWTNYLRPDIKRGPFTPEEQKSIIQLHGIVGNKWSAIAAQLPGRTDNEIKNYWNTHLKKHLLKIGIDPDTCAPTTSTITGNSPSAMAVPGSATRHMAQWESARLEAEARLSRKPSTSEDKTDADFFLRLWNSEVGNAFRGNKVHVSDQVLTEEEEEEEEDVECKSSVTNGGGGGEASEDVCEESYQLYLDFEGGDDIAMESLFHGQLESFNMFGDGSLESDFK